MQCFNLRIYIHRETPPGGSSNRFEVNQLFYFDYFKPPKSPRNPSSEMQLTTPKPMQHSLMEATPQDTAVVPETPKQLRGILKQNDVYQKRRRVAFAGSDEQRTSSEEEEKEKQSLKVTKVSKFYILCLSTVVFLICYQHIHGGLSFAGKKKRQGNRKGEPKEHTTGECSIFSKAIFLEQ